MRGEQVRKQQERRAQMCEEVGEKCEEEALTQCIGNEF